MGGIKDKLDYMMNLSDLDYDGYRGHSQTKSTLFNGKFGYALNNSSKLTTTLNVADSPLADDPGGLTAEEVEEDRSQARGKNVKLNTGESLKQTRLGFVYKNELNNTDTLTLNNYYISREIDIRIPAGRLGAGVNLERFSMGGGAQYTRAQSLAGYENRFTVGLDIANQNDERQRFNLDGVGTSKQIQDQDEQVSSLGIFIQDELALTDKTELTLGGRYDRIDFDVKDKFISDGDDSGNRAFDEFSPSVALSYSATDKLNIYGNISKSFETPTARELGNPNGGGFNKNLKPQTATNFEVGLKGRLSKRNRFELAIFSIDVDDELISFENEDETFYENAGESKRKGVELLFETKPLAGLSASLAYTYSDFKFKKFVDSEGEDFSGKNIPGIPENLLHLEVSYWHTSGLYGQFDVLKTDKMYANNDNSVSAKAHSVSNLRLGYSQSVGDWEISPFVGVNNLFNEEYNGNLRINAFGHRFFEPAPEKNIYGGLEICYDFGG